MARNRRQRRQFDSQSPASAVGAHAVNQLSEPLEERVLMTVSSPEAYSWYIINKMREDPPKFASELEGMYRGTLDFAHGYRADDPVWADFRSLINNGQYSHHFWQALALLRAQPRLGPLAFEDSLHQVAETHSRWMQTSRCFSHSSSPNSTAPPCDKRIPGLADQGSNHSPNVVTPEDLGDWSTGASAENIGYSYLSGLTETGKRYSRFSAEYAQRWAYLDALGFITEVNSTTLGHVRNLLSRDRRGPTSFSLTGKGKNKSIGQLNTIGISHVAAPHATNPQDRVLLTTHKLSQSKPSTFPQNGIGGYVVGMVYQDNNRNGWYDIGEGLQNFNYTFSPDNWCVGSGDQRLCGGGVSRGIRFGGHGMLNFDTDQGGWHTVTVFAGADQSRQLGSHLSYIRPSGDNFFVEMRVGSSLQLASATEPDEGRKDPLDAEDETLGDSQQTAIDLGTLTPGSQLDNAPRVLTIHNADDSDWFRFNVTGGFADLHLNAGFDHSEGDIDVRLYRLDADGNRVIVASATSTTDNEQIEEELAPGTYLIHAYGYGSHTNFYALTIDAAMPYSVGEEIALHELQSQFTFNPVDDEFHNWGGHDERWLQSESGEWFFILPDGALYEWNSAARGDRLISDSRLIARLPRQTYEVPEDLTQNLLPPSLSGMIASRIDTQFDLISASEADQNWAGLNEKWLRGGSGHWLFMLPDGAVYEWHGERPGVEFLKKSIRVGTLDQSYYATPAHLTNSTLSDSQSLILREELDRELELYALDDDFLNWGGQQERWIRSREGFWYFITPDGTLWRWEGVSTGELIKDSTRIGVVGTDCWDAPDRLTTAADAHGMTTARLRFLTFQLDQQLQLSSEASERFNFAGLGEKWLNASNGQEYFILPDGSFYRWSGTSEEGVTLSDAEFLIQLSPQHHATPTMLFEAEPELLSAAMGRQMLLKRVGALQEYPSLQNWGGLGEKWLRHESGQWYFITTSGAVYEWEPGSHGSEIVARSRLLVVLDSSYHAAPATLTTTNWELNVLTEQAYDAFFADWDALLLAV